jgi:hypothetical protein
MAATLRQVMSAPGVSTVVEPDIVRAGHPVKQEPQRLPLSPRRTVSNVRANWNCRFPSSLSSSYASKRPHSHPPVANRFPRAC